jgi:hypothetical protein
MAIAVVAVNVGFGIYFNSPALYASDDFYYVYSTLLLVFFRIILLITPTILFLRLILLLENSELKMIVF